MRVLNETEFAAWQRDSGHKIILSGGQHWREAMPGYFQCLHYFSQMKAAEARKPAPFCWAFRTSLSVEDAAKANTAWPLCVLRDLDQYDESSLRRSVRQDLSKGRRKARYVRLLDAGLLREQGYDVYASATSRVGKKGRLSREAYLARLDRFAKDDRRLIVAALVGDQLVGYCDSFAVEGYAYGWNIYVGTEHLGTNATIALEFETMQAYRRTGKVSTGVSGPDTPELESLMAFKERLGFEVFRLPAKLWMLPPARLVIRKTRPWAYYRMTGQFPREPG